MKESMLRNLKLDAYYKYLIAIFSALLVISLSGDIQASYGIPESMLSIIRNISVGMIVVSVIIWLLDSIIEELISAFCYKNTLRPIKSTKHLLYMRNSYHKKAFALNTMWKIVQISAYMSVLIIITR